MLPGIITSEGAELPKWTPSPTKGHRGVADRSKIIASSLFRRLKLADFSTHEIVAVTSHLIELLTKDLQPKDLPLELNLSDSRHDDEPF